jgi:hypothetical protein
MGSEGLTDVQVTALAHVEHDLRVLEHRMAAVRLAILPTVEAAGIWALDGSRSFPAWLARHDNIPGFLAQQETRYSRALRDTLPATRSAALTGTVGIDHVGALADAATSDNRRAALGAPVTGFPTRYDAHGDVMPDPTGEEYLLAQADLHPLPGFRRLVRRFAHVADPTADDRGYRDTRDREHFELGLTLGGWHVTGFLTEEHGAALNTALNAIMGTPTPGEDRTTTQRRAQALADLARITLDQGHTAAGATIRPHLNVTVSWEELHRLIATTGATNRCTEDAGSTARTRPGTVALAEMTRTPAILEGSTGPLPDAVLRTLACDSEITRVVFGPDSQILNVGRARRTVPRQLRRAVIARDQHCTYPGCNEPPSRCDVHHAQQHWAAQQGETSTTNSALHHARVGTHHVTMRWHPRGGWHFTDRHGNPITHRPLRGDTGATEVIAMEVINDS